MRFLGRRTTSDRPSDQVSMELLWLAQSLVPADAGRGRPKTVSLRRAVSTAYYALFHELIDGATAELCGRAPSAREQRDRMARWFAHLDIASLAGALVAVPKPTAAQKAIQAIAVPTHVDLLRVADAFLTLQAARHDADYNHAYDIKRLEARLLIDTARDAIERLRRLAAADDESYRQFLKLMVGAVKIAKGR